MKLKSVNFSLDRCCHCNSVLQSGGIYQSRSPALVSRSTHFPFGILFLHTYCHAGCFSFIACLCLLLFVLCCQINLIWFISGRHQNIDILQMYRLTQVGLLLALRVGGWRNPVFHSNLVNIKNMLRQNRSIFILASKTMIIFHLTFMSE